MFNTLSVVAPKREAIWVFEVLQVLLDGVQSGYLMSIVEVSD